MSLWKSLLATAFTAALIFAMAFLPVTLSDLQDRYAHTDYAYADIGAVELQMDNGSIWERIALLSSGYDSFEISPEQASISPEELNGYIEAELQPYIDRGVLPYVPDYTTDINEVQCAMVYDQKTAKATGCIFWMAVLIDRETGDHLELLLDDHSGKIVFLNYCTKDYYGSCEHPPYDLLHLFLYTYLEEMGDDTWEYEVLEATPAGSMIHTAVVLENPDTPQTLVLSFLVDSAGLNMSVSNESYGLDK